MTPLLILGCAIIVLGNLWFAALAFRVSLFWGLAVLFIPFVSLMFLVKFCDRAKWAWWFSLSGLVMCLVQKAINS